MVRVGIAGIGFMGVTHYKAWAQIANARVAAVSSRDPKKLAGDWARIQGNFGGAGGLHDLSSIKGYSSLDQMLADPEIDLIDLCLPTPLHADNAVAALEAGKHVLVEKPIALSVADADRMIAAANANGRQLMVAQVLRFWPEWLYLKQVHDSSEFGKLVGLNLRRVISAPSWSQDASNVPANGGPLVDLHIHDVDFMIYLLGRPRRVAATGVVGGNGCVTYVSSTYDFGRNLAVSCQSGAITMRARPFQHHFEAYFEQATISAATATEPAGVDPALKQGASQVLTVYHADGTVSFPKTPTQEAFQAQLQHVADCIDRNMPSTIIGAQTARDALALVLLEGKAIESGQWQNV